jgi:hypothetical protein
VHLTESERKPHMTLLSAEEGAALMDGRTAAKVD